MASLGQAQLPAGRLCRAPVLVGHVAAAAAAAAAGSADQEQIPRREGPPLSVRRPLWPYSG
eukprot:scaffold1929_cov376-Prasinococcus_capsulatus_cf.AAC.21